MFHATRSAIIAQVMVKSVSPLVFEQCERLVFGEGYSGVRISIIEEECAFFVDEGLFARISSGALMSLARRGRAMQRLQRRIVGFCISFLLLLVVGVPVVMSNFAPRTAHIAFARALASSPTAVGNVNSQAGVTPGTLSSSAGGATPVNATLAGSSQTATFSVPITVNDNTGSGTGWGLDITASSFTCGSCANALGTPTTRTLVAGLKIASEPTPTCTGSSCVNPTDPVSYASHFVVPTGTAQEFYGAQMDTGMGNFTLTSTFTVTFPPTSFAGSYSSTMTISITSGP